MLRTPSNSDGKAKHHAHVGSACDRWNVRLDRRLPTYLVVRGIQLSGLCRPPALQSRLRGRSVRFRIVRCRQVAKSPQAGSRSPGDRLRAAFSHVRRDGPEPIAWIVPLPLQWDNSFHRYLLANRRATIWLLEFSILLSPIISLCTLQRSTPWLCCAYIFVSVCEAPARVQSSRQTHPKRPSPAWGRVFTTQLKSPFSTCGRGLGVGLDIPGCGIAQPQV